MNKMFNFVIFAVVTTDIYYSGYLLLLGLQKFKQFKARIKSDFVIFKRVTIVLPTDISLLFFFGILLNFIRLLIDN